MFFEKEDYEIFNSKNNKLNTSVVKAKRNDIKQKLLELHHDIVTDYIWNQYGLHAHEKPENITSVDYPMMMNQYTVGWMGLRYGRSAPDIKVLNDALGITWKTQEDKKYGFQKYNNFEICLHYDCMMMGLFHSTRYDGVDRSQIYPLIRDMDVNFLSKLEKILQDLQGYGFVFRSYGKDEKGQDECAEFHFDKYYPEDLITNFRSYYIKYCNAEYQGYTNMLMRIYPIYDKRIQTKEQIIAEFFDVIDHLLPLYHLFSWKPNK